MFKHAISLLLSFVVVFGLSSSPAHANGTVVVNCGGGGTFKVTANIAERDLDDVGCSGSVVIPEGVEEIAADAFVEKNVTSVSLPTTLRLINGNAFAETRLVSITIPAGVTGIGPGAFGFNLFTHVTFLGSAPTLIAANNYCVINACEAFNNVPDGAKVIVKSAFRDSFVTSGTPARWQGLILEVEASTQVPVIETPAPVINTAAPVVDSVALAAAADLAARTIATKKNYAAKALAKQVGVSTVSTKATVTISVAKSSKKICTKSGSKLKTLKSGNCVATFTVQEPKPKGGKKPKATKTTKTLVVK